MLEFNYFHSAIIQKTMKNNYNLELNIESRIVLYVDIDVAVIRLAILEKDAIFNKFDIIVKKNNTCFNFNNSFSHSLLIKGHHNF